MASDEELMSAVAEGDMDAFEELVLRHQDGAFHVAFRLLSDEDRAGDAAQEAFLRVLDAAPRYRPTAAFRTYLYRILTRICIDQYRRRTPRQHPDPAGVPSEEAGPPEALLQRERAEQVRAAIQDLPPRQRVAVVLRHYEGLAYEEIAGAMGVSVRAVDALLSRARRALKGRLRDLL